MAGELQVQSNRPTGVSTICSSTQNTPSKHKNRNLIVTKSFQVSMPTFVAKPEEIDGKLDSLIN
jgi:hypothetical protein